MASKSSQILSRLFTSLSQSEELEGRNLVVQKAGILTPDVRVMIGVTGLDISPIILWHNPSQTKEEGIEALAWATGHLALGHLISPKEGLQNLTVATLGSHLPNLLLTNDWFLRKSRNDFSLKAFVWAAMFLVDPKRYHDLRQENTIRETREIIAEELTVPVRLIRLWEKCQRISPVSLERLVGKPRDWADTVLARKGE